MPEVVKTGVPYPSDHAGPVDDWSERVYASLRDWHVASGGKWTRWEPGYLLLTITCVSSEEVEPVQLYTADEELTVEFGCWLTHNPAPFGLEAPPEMAAEYAKALVEQWLAGLLRTAVLTDASGKWCGSSIIKPGELLPQLKAAAQLVRDFYPERIEMRTPAKRRFSLLPWVEWA